MTYVHGSVAPCFYFHLNHPGFFTCTSAIMGLCQRLSWKLLVPLGWRHNGQDGVSNHQPHHCLLNRLFGWRSKKTSKLRVTGLCAENSPGTDEFPAQMASNAENVSIWWRHHASNDRQGDIRHLQSWNSHTTETTSPQLRQIIPYSMLDGRLWRDVWG